MIVTITQLNFKSLSTRRERLELDPEHKKHKYNLKKVNWIKYSEALEKTITFQIPNNRNLSIQEINEYIQILNDKIIEAMENNLPKIKDKNLINAYINDKIKKIQKQKIKYPNTPRP